MTVARPTYRPDIDGLRAISVLGVVVYHARERLLPGGFIGVDVFFVISGFLISGIILADVERGTFSLGRFYQRRIRRIFPALALVLGVSWLAGWWLLEPSPYALLGKHIAAGAGFVYNFMVWGESGYFDVAGRQKPLLHLWSLGIEEQFYLVWPLLLWWSTRTGRRGGAGLLGIGFALSFALNVARVDADPIGTFYLPFGRLWELVGGAALAAWTSHHPASLARVKSARVRMAGSTVVRVADIMAWSGLALILAAMLTLSGDAFPGWRALLPTGGAALLIVSGPDAFASRAILSNRLAIWLGLISYPLYLWHWPVLTFGRLVHGGELPRLETVLLVLTALGLSAATYYGLEQPIRAGRLGGRPETVPALAGALGGLVVVGAATVAAQGFVQRYPPAIRPLLGFQVEASGAFRTGRCMLSRDQGRYAEECAGVSGNGDPRPLLIIWGDSHGAMLYRALEAAASRRGVAVAQFTASSCPPVIDFTLPNRPHCGPLNQFVLARIPALRPEIVLLAHDWPQSRARRSLDQLGPTVRVLRARGVQHLVLLGPVPRWQAALPEVLVKDFARRHRTEVPERLRDGLEAEIPVLNDQLARTAAGLGIAYLDAYRTFCTADGCLVTDRATRQPSAFDAAHLMPWAADLLVAAHVDVLLPPAVLARAALARRPVGSPRPPP